MARTILIAITFAVILAGGLLNDVLKAEGQGSVWPREAVRAGTDGIDFVPNEACAGCHTDQWAAWRTSHHFHAMERASDETVLGDFTGALFTHGDGAVTRFHRRDGGYFIHTAGPDGAAADFEVLYTFGIEPLQQYLVALPGGRLQAFTIAWDPAAGRWFDLYPAARSEPGDPLHWTGRLNNWNARCAECHSTDLRTNYDPAIDSFRTEWSGLTVGCQACHGPGQAHVAWAQSGLAGNDNGLVVDYGALSPRGAVETCARCHSRRHRIGVDDVHGRPFLDDFAPALLREDLYHADGQIQDEVYVYGSFAQSRMYQAGVVCTDCHDAHSGGLVAEGNAVCTQCHQETPTGRFAGRGAGLYDSPAHHFHPADSAGAQCVNCHMPSQTYMVVDPRRDHSLRIPSPALSLAIGSPNACTGCHVDRTDSWAADRVAEWYGTGGRRPAHYGEVLAAGRRGDPAAAAGLAALAEASEAPAIVRATALDMLPRFGAEGAAAIVAGLKDPDALVRAAAARGLAIGSVEERLPLLFPLLSDPVRAVRIEAARLLAPIPVERMEDQLRRPFEAALAEYMAAQTGSAETPEAHLNLAGLHIDQGRAMEAEAEYRTAIALAPDFLAARLGLANLYNALRRNDEAEAALRTALRLEPESGDAHYALGLLLAEMGRPDEAVFSLSVAARLMPRQPRIHYNLALALQQAGRMAESEPALLTANRLDPRDPDTLHALAIHYAGKQDWDRASRYATELVRRLPDDPGPPELLRQIERLRGG